MARKDKNALQRAESVLGNIFTPSHDWQSRGVRNNNPGNMEYHEQGSYGGQGFAKAHGATGYGDAGRFAAFPSPDLGIASIFAKQREYEQAGADTVAKRIEKWSPASENGTANTKAYIKAVASQMGIDPNTSFSIKDPVLGNAFVSAMIHHENGSQPYTPEQINMGRLLTDQISPSEQAREQQQQQARLGLPSPPSPGQQMASAQSMPAPSFNGYQPSPSAPSSKPPQDDLSKQIELKKAQIGELVTGYISKNPAMAEQLTATMAEHGLNIDGTSLSAKPAAAHLPLAPPQSMPAPSFNGYQPNSLQLGAGTATAGPMPSPDVSANQPLAAPPAPLTGQAVSSLGPPPPSASTAARGPIPTSPLTAAQSMPQSAFNGYQPTPSPAQQFGPPMPPAPNGMLRPDQVAKPFPFDGLSPNNPLPAMPPASATPPALQSAFTPDNSMPASPDQRIASSLGPPPPSAAPSPMPPPPSSPLGPPPSLASNGPMPPLNPVSPAQSSTSIMGQSPPVGPTASKEALLSPYDPSAAPGIGSDIGATQKVAAPSPTITLASFTSPDRVKDDMISKPPAPTVPSPMMGPPSPVSAPPGGIDQTMQMGIGLPPPTNGIMPVGGMLPSTWNAQKQKPVMPALAPPIPAPPPVTFAPPQPTQAPPRPIPSILPPLPSANKPRKPLTPQQQLMVQAALEAQHQAMGMNGGGGSRGSNSGYGGGYGGGYQGGTYGGYGGGNIGEGTGGAFRNR